MLSISSCNVIHLAGSLQLNALGDIMMEHVASYLGQDPIGMKFANLFKNGQITLQGNLVTHCQIRNLYQSMLMF